MKKEITYKGKDVTVLWKPDKCIHSGNCVKGLPGVFKPDAKPWVNVEAASGPAIIDQVGKCPSGALSILSDESASDTQDTSNELIIEISGNGPYLIKDGCVIKDQDGNEIQKSGTVALCRCGMSSNKPFCDGSHNKSDWL